MDSLRRGDLDLLRYGERCPRRGDLDLRLGDLDRERLLRLDFFLEGDLEYERGIKVGLSSLKFNL